MIATLPDYKVGYLRVDVIAQIALRVRALGPLGNAAYFNIVDFIVYVLTPRLLARTKFHIEFFDAPEGGLPAYVNFRAPENGRPPVVTLHVDREIWELAAAGDPVARFILAHEIGHLVLHDHGAKAFSNSDDPTRIRFVGKEETAEWQADTFALCFLMPAKLVVSFPDAQSLAKAVAVEERWAIDRFNAVSEENLRFSAYSGYPCEQCGEFTMSREGIEMKCKCGFSKPVI